MGKMMEIESMFTSKAVSGGFKQFFVFKPVSGGFKQFFVFKPCDDPNWLSHFRELEITNHPALQLLHNQQWDRNGGSEVNGLCWEVYKIEGAVQTAVIF